MKMEDPVTVLNKDLRYQEDTEFVYEITRKNQLFQCRTINQTVLVSLGLLT